MEKGRCFKEYSGAEADTLSVHDRRSLDVLEGTEAFLMYESTSKGPNTGVVRFGRINDITVSGTAVSFRLEETGRLNRSVVEELGSLLGLDGFEYNRTHWAIKDGKVPKLVRDKIEMVPERYDVALSFAGEDRPYVEKVANYLAAKGVAVFYDKFEEATLWGVDLAEHLDWVYRLGTQFCVMFVSKHYAEKMWPNHERKSALATAVKAQGTYILPARFDSTELPGLRPTIGYINLDKKSPVELGDLIIKKLGHLAGTLATLLAAENLPVPEAATGKDAEIKEFRSNYDAFLRRLESEWVSERDSDPRGTSDGKAILEWALDQVHHFRSQIVAGLGEFAQGLDEAARGLREIHRHQLFLDGGKSWGEFWSKGNELVDKLKALTPKIAS